jgi:CheY-like chemotaxis protein
VRLHVVRDGQDALDFLFRRGAYARVESAPRPHLVLLDLNLPKVSGHEVLRAIKRDEALRTIPVVVFTTSDREEDVEQAYRLGGNSYFAKPGDLDAYRRLLDIVQQYWTRQARLPM